MEDASRSGAGDIQSRTSSANGCTLCRPMRMDDTGQRRPISSVEVQRAGATVLIPGTGNR
jgi:hypothetical protein